MELKRRALLGSAAAALTLAGCLGDDGEPGDTEPTPTPTPTPTPAPATVEAGTHDDLGNILVDENGMTLYMFDADEQGATDSACYDECAQNWPPLLVDDEPVAGDGVTAELDTIEREDGSMQVTANGWPLYYFVNDGESGVAAGQGVNDVWWVLRPNGNPVRGADEGDVDVASHPDLGDVLVDADGMTLYMFDADEQGSGASACYDECEDNWPPLTVEEEPAATAAVSTDLGTIEREDGSMQVTANGWPLYYFIGDEEPGDVAGQGVNDVWWVLRPDGTPFRGEDDPTVQVSSHDELGEILIGPDGMTLYMFDADEQGSGASACYDECEDNWPPLIDDEPVAGDGVDADLTTFEREDGSSQVAANGWPLYFFAADMEPGDVEGQGVNDVWWVLRTDGAPYRGDDDDDNGGSRGPGY